MFLFSAAATFLGASLRCLCTSVCTCSVCQTHSRRTTSMIVVAARRKQMHPSPLPSCIYQRSWSSISKDSTFPTIGAPRKTTLVVPALHVTLLFSRSSMVCPISFVVICELGIRGAAAQWYSQSIWICHIFCHQSGWRGPRLPISPCLGLSTTMEVLEVRSHC